MLTDETNAVLEQIRSHMAVVRSDVQVRAGLGDPLARSVHVMSTDISMLANLVELLLTAPSRRID